MGKPVFLTTSTGDDATAGFACFPIIFYHNDKLTSVVHRSDPATHISNRMAKLEANPVRAAALARARQRVGQWLSEEKLPQLGLAALRMQTGLSQKKLAEKLGTQQSNISRWEKAPGDMQYSTIKSLAIALGVAPTEVIAAIESSAPKEEHDE
jgi:DNA-binding transcriptional regulator YiaG